MTNGSKVRGRVLATYLVSFVTVVAATPAMSGAFMTDARSFSLYRPGQCSTFHPVAHAVADMDGDGDLDLVHTYSRGFFCGTAPSFSILLNDGAGSYGPPRFFTTPAGDTNGVAAADLDGDGDLDLALTEYFVGRGNSVLIFLNNGDATFQAQRRYFCAPTPFDVATSDVDRDGDIDLVTSGRNGTSISILYNDGAAAFDTRVDVPVSGSSRCVDVGDMNGDTFPDIVLDYTTGSADVAVLLNDGTGAFSEVVDYDVPGVGSLHGQARIGDLDDDGDPDLLYSRTQVTGYEGPVAMMENDGSGTLINTSFYSTALEFSGHVGDIADVTGDGLTDVVVYGMQLGLPGWVLLENTGGGDFESRGFFTAGDTDGELYDLTIADVTGDSYPDVVVTNSYSSTVRVHAQRPTREFAFPDLVPVEGMTIRLAVGDIDQDGDVDAVTAYSTGIHRLINQGDFTFVPSVQPVMLSCMEAIDLADLNNDSFPDLMLLKDTDCPSYEFYTAMNNGDGTFGPIVTWPLGSAGRNEFATLDWDADGDLDVVVSEGLGCQNCDRYRIFYLENRGDGTFETAVVEPHLTLGGLKLATADFNEDGNMDFAGSFSPGPVLFSGNGDGTFDRTLTTVPIQPPSWMDTADMNGDSHADLVCTSGGNPDEGGGVTYVLLGDGTGGFTQSDWESGPWHLQYIPEFSIEALDADRDGNMDIVVSHISGGDILLFRGNGDGTIEPQERYGINGSAFELRAADFDGDGGMDLAVVGRSGLSIGPGVTFLRNGTLSPAGVGDSDSVPTVLTESRLNLLASPNPMRAGGVFELSTMTAGQARLTLFDVGGRKLETVFSGHVAAGTTHISWSASDLAASSGIYFVRAETSEGTALVTFSILR